MSWLKNRARLSPTTVFQRRAAMLAFRQAGTLQERLARAPWLFPYLRWIRGDGAKFNYNRWTKPMCAKLDECYVALEQGQPYMHAPLDRASSLDNSNRVVVAAAQAFDLYAGQVAHVLYVEAHAKVPWSIANMDEVELLELLSSDRYFSRIAPSSLVTGVNYPAHIQADRDYFLPYNADGQVFDPRVGYRFVRGETSTSGRDHLGPTPRTTIVNLTRWVALTHKHGVIDPNGFDPNAWFQLEDRLLGRPQPMIPGGPLVITRDQWGCHSSAHLLHDVARCINLPLIRIVTRYAPSPTSGAHRGLVFFDENETESGKVYQPSNTLPRGLLESWTDRWRRDRSRFTTILGWLGLTTPTQRRLALVLAHTDDIYALQLDPCFPISSVTAPVRMTPEEKWLYYFEKTWLPRRELARWGHVLPDHYDLNREPMANAGLSDQGVNGGWWPDVVLYNAFIFERRMLLGSWHDYLKIYSAHPNSLNSGYYNQLSTAKSPLSDYWARLSATLSAYDTGTSLAMQAAEQESNAETSVLPGPPP